jgi:hypothetical protein
MVTPPVASTKRRSSSSVSTIKNIGYVVPPEKLKQSKQEQDQDIMTKNNKIKSPAIKVNTKNDNLPTPAKYEASKLMITKENKLKELNQKYKRAVAQKLRRAKASESKKIKVTADDNLVKQSETRESSGICLFY